jgi:hypothetical protein
VAIIINTNHFKNEKTEIDQWILSHNYELVNKDWQWTPFGSPYNYVNRGEYIWKVNVKDSLNKPRVIWVRTNILGNNDYEFE